jgi:hypothetical protein
MPPKTRIAGISKDEMNEATKWIGGLDRIHSARGVLTCFDMSATPFAPTGRKSGEETLFKWIVSDFGLNDAIESGLVKTPRVVVRDDGVGLPSGLDPQRVESLGLSIVRTLVSRDLRGRLRMWVDGGTIAEVAFRR